MSRDSLSFKFALVGFLSPVLKRIDGVLQNCSQDTLVNIVLYLIASLFIGLVFKQTESRKEPVKVAGIEFPPWLPSAICCLCASFFLMQL